MSVLRAIIAAGLLAGLSACTDPNTAREVAEAEGFTDVHVTSGYAAWSCGKDDFYATGFTARGANGKCVTGVVCSAALKGATLRITGSQPCPPAVLVPEAR